jgi:FAD/FMN-containing dehydrogenase
LLKAVPIIDDGAVPFEQVAAYIAGVYDLFKKANLKVALWGHVGDANLHVQPRLNLGHVGDRQKAFKMMDEYYRMLIGLGGVVSSESSDGRLRAPYVESQYGAELYAIMQKVKFIFDPYSTMNPGVIFGSSIDDLKELVRQDYGHDHHYDHLPRS